MHKRGAGKRGVSEVVVTILLILLAISSVLLVWSAVKFLLNKSSPDISVITSDVKIISVAVDEETTHLATIKLQREAGEGNVVGVRFAFYNEAGGSYIYDDKTGLAELETRTYTIDLTNQISNVNKISIALIFESGISDVKSGAEKINDEWKITKGKSRDGSITGCKNNNDCRADYYSPNYCDGNDVKKDKHDFSCVSRSCVKDVVAEVVESCGAGTTCSNGLCVSIGSEICGDYIDNNGNGLIDENCYGNIPMISYNSRTNNLEQYGFTHMLKHYGFSSLPANVRAVYYVQGGSGVNQEGTFSYNPTQAEKDAGATYENTVNFFYPGYETYVQSKFATKIATEDFLLVDYSTMNSEQRFGSPDPASTNPGTIATIQQWRNILVQDGVLTTGNEEFPSVSANSILNTPYRTNPTLIFSDSTTKVVSKNDVGWKFAQWWRFGRGSYVRSWQIVSQIYQANNLDVKIYSEPFGVAASGDNPLDINAGGNIMGALSTWEYAKPIPKMPLFMGALSKQLRAFAGDREVIQGTQLHEAGGWSEKGLTVPKDVLLQSSWNALAFGGTGLQHWGMNAIEEGSTFELITKCSCPTCTETIRTDCSESTGNCGSECNPYYWDDLSFNQGSSGTLQGVKDEGATLKKIKNVFEALKPSQKKAAYLFDDTSHYYIPYGNWFDTGEGNMMLLSYIIKSGIPIDYLSYFNINKLTKQNYDVVFVRKFYGYLSEDVYNKLKEFDAAGGKIITSDPFLTGQGFQHLYQADNSIFKGIWGDVQNCGGDGSGPSALEYQDTIKSKGDYFKSFVRPLLGSPLYAEVNTNDVVFETYDYGNSNDKVLFVVNDNRGYGAWKDYFASKYLWQDCIVADAGVPTTATFTINDNVNVYQFNLETEAWDDIAETYASGKTSFTITVDYPWLDMIKLVKV